MTVVDCHTHVGESLYGGGLSAGELLSRMGELGIGRAVVIPPKPPGYHFEPENRRILELAREHPERLTPFCRVDPWQRERAVAEVERCLAREKMAGLFLHPWEENFAIDDPVVDSLLAPVGGAGVPVMIAGGHTRVSLAAQIGDLVRRWPGITFIVTSGGQINVSGVALSDARTLLRENPNTLMETSGVYRLDFIEDMAAEIGAERILFGSDAPRYDQELELRRVVWSHRPEPERLLMGGGNALRVLGLQTPVL